MVILKAEITTHSQKKEEEKKKICPDSASVSLKISVFGRIGVCALSLWHSEMKDMLVLLCCSGPMVNNWFIFITVQYVNGLRECACLLVCVCARVCVSLTSISGSYYMDIWNSVPAPRLSRGRIIHLPQILCLLGGAWALRSDLMRGEGFVAANFSIHPKEEVRCFFGGEEEEGEKKKTRCSCSQLLFLGEKEWQLIPEGTSLSPACQHRQATSFTGGALLDGKSRPPMGISPPLNSGAPYLRGRDSLTFIMQCLWKNGSPLCQILRLFFHFLISKRGLRCSRLRGNRMRWGRQEVHCGRKDEIIWRGGRAGKGGGRREGEEKEIKLRFKRCADRTGRY